MLLERNPASQRDCRQALEGLRATEFPMARRFGCWASTQPQVRIPFQATVGRVGTGRLRGLVDPWECSSQAISVLGNRIYCLIWSMWH